MKNQNLALKASGDIDSDLEILELKEHVAKKETMEVTTQNNLLKVFSMLRAICLSQSRMRIYVHLSQNQHTSACELHEKLGISKSTIFRELRQLQRMDLIYSSNCIPDGRGMPYSRYNVVCAHVHELFLV